MVEILSRLFRIERGEWLRLLQFGLFGFLLQMGMGVGFSAGDAAFLSNVGADRLPLVFMLTPAVMLLYTVLFSYLLVRFSIDRMVDITLAALIAGGVGFWALIDAGLPPGWQTPLYFALKLYLAMWYIALYSLFWNYTDAYFDIQDAKRLFPLFAAFCALGTAMGALVVSVSAKAVPVQYFFLLWAAIAFATLPLTRLLRRRWQQIAENDVDLDEQDGSALEQLAAVGRAFGRSRYTIVFTLTLFVTLLMTNLAEYQYSMVLQEGRDEAGLAGLFGTLYAAASLFNLVTCLFVFNRLVARLGVRNVAFIQPLTYFAVFGWFFLKGGTGAALAAFFAYHGVLTSIEYNNQNLLFNAVPSRVKRPLRTVMEGLAEPLASLVAGGFLLYAASYVDMRELSGIGIIIGGLLIAIVVALRALYPTAMAANMRQGWMNFGNRAVVEAARLDAEAHARLEAASAGKDPAGELAARLLQTVQDAPPEPSERAGATDSEVIPDILAATARLAPRDRRAVVARLAAIGETAIPRLIGGMRETSLPYRSRALAARALAEVSYAQFARHLDRLVREELREARRLLAGAAVLERHEGEHASLVLLARAQRERVGAALDFVLELLAIGGLLPNFDLLIVSLHSANAKVRGNAIEAIESGIDGALFRLLDPLLRPQDGARAEAGTAGNLADVLDAAMAGGQPIEMTLAADVLHDRLDTAAFARVAQRVIRPGMPELLRLHLLDLMGLGDGQGLRLPDVLAALAVHPEVGGATLEALLALSAAVVLRPPGEGGLCAKAGGRTFWVSHLDLRDVAGRFPDLALVLLKSQDDRQYAA
ncbi:MFS transporter [Novosphingobium mangrovi (ex Huang et al. 2023)]|uniref:MFS transporter n=1 Tax=Novosphingobium mangrovi (ex Huang et al. 2023) TaxID=2976432 RepID=A0ABT2I9N0_9SPHN|nr:MFS transporter [Novosphingobium mangrovi (ex Huang et al. 2023)]MCT2401528.1 MFS transporter [Novosphingobium mangrovi (ex Huang et al. 2023)]